MSAKSRRKIDLLRAELADVRAQLASARALLPVRRCFKCGADRTADQVAQVRPGRWMCNHGACPTSPVSGGMP